MAWMRMMGADSVEYHRATVLDRGDDHPDQTLDYYGSRGETPMRWLGDGSERLGLSGQVTSESYAAVFGPDGARDPVFGTRLTKTRRPGIELVVAAHKSVAELGVIGRADDMHRILDAERNATVTYLEAVVLERGGRRGRSAISTATSGLVIASTRHATTRAGDPGPHDHVLVANAVEMLDERGGWKALHTTLLRDHLHAATMVGRLAAARVAVELGYGIVGDDGPSGRLRAWGIAGVPGEVLALHSKRSDEIDAAIDSRGVDGYQARAVAARETRRAKTTAGPDQLLDRWRRELADIGYPVDMLAASVDAAAASTPGRLAPHELDRMVASLLDLDGPLAASKVFARRDVIVAVAPLLYGRDPAELNRVVAAVLAHPETVPLLSVAGATEPVHALAALLAIEHAIAERVASGLAGVNGPVVATGAVWGAIDEHEATLGRDLTDGQRQAVLGVCTSGRQIELVVGVAGAGKTTALAVVTDAFQTAGYQVLGTSTAGQAARTLEHEAGMPARTLASLLWRMEHHQMTLDERTVVVLDEAGMTDDPDLHRLLIAAGHSGAKVILVGDDRQLSAVGPGGGLGALIARHHPAVHHLSENLRQADPNERSALAQLRDGDIEIAVDWYIAHQRIHPAATRGDALDQVVARWLDDVTSGADSTMLAWRRANVAALNERARAVWAGAGRLSGEEVLLDGRQYRAGDRLVLLAPNRRHGLVTSQRADVAAVDPAQLMLTIRTDDDRTFTLGPDECSRDRIDHGYATTVHRAQGTTVDTTHVLEDGGGRELAYVKASRARGNTSIHLVADDVDQAREDLLRDWSAERRQRWVIDTHQPEPTRDGTIQQPPPALRAAIDRLRLADEAWALEQLDRTIDATPPPDVDLDQRLARIRARLSKSLAGPRVEDAVTDRLAASLTRALTETPLARSLDGHQQAPDAGSDIGLEL